MFQLPFHWRSAQVLPGCCCIVSVRAAIPSQLEMWHCVTPPPSPPVTPPVLSSLPSLDCSRGAEGPGQHTGPGVGAGWPGSIYLVSSLPSLIYSTASSSPGRDLSRNAAFQIVWAFWKLGQLCSSRKAACAEACRQHLQPAAPGLPGLPGRACLSEAASLPLPCLEACCSPTRLHTSSLHFDSELTAAFSELESHGRGGSWLAGLQVAFSPVSGEGALL